MRALQFVPMAKTATLPPDLTTQAGRLRWAREKAGYSSMRQAANRFEWNENTYKSHELGIRGAEGIKPRYLDKYARAFMVDLQWLTYGTGSPARTERDPAHLARELLKALDSK